MFGTSYLLVQSVQDYGNVPLCKVLTRIENLVHVAVINIGNDIVASLHDGFIQGLLLAFLLAN